MKKIILSVSIIAVVAAVVFGVTTAFFSDTETSTGNTFTAGALDLKVDNTCYYNKVADGVPNCPWADSSWSLTDLQNGVQKFFNFSDIKPGDFGEDTVSLHVDNDAWLRIVIDQAVDTEGNPACTEPESATEYVSETDKCPHATGELRPQLLFSIWIDNGAGGKEHGGVACDNIKNGNEGIMGIEKRPINAGGETWNPSAFLLKGTTCFGIAWELPLTVGNNAQTDVFGFNASFQVQQVRNNPQPQW